MLQLFKAKGHLHHQHGQTQHHINVCPLSLQIELVPLHTHNYWLTSTLALLTVQQLSLSLANLKLVEQINAVYLEQSD